MPATNVGSTMWWSGNPARSAELCCDVRNVSRGKAASREWLEPIKGSKFGYVVLDVTECVESCDYLNGVTVQVEVASSVWRGAQRKNAAGWYTTAVLSVPLSASDDIPHGFVGSFRLAFGDVNQKQDVLFASIPPGSPCVELAMQRKAISGDKAKLWSLSWEASSRAGVPSTHRLLACVAYVLDDYATATLSVQAVVEPLVDTADVKSDAASSITTFRTWEPRRVV